MSDKPSCPKDPPLDFNLRFKDVLDALDLIGERLRTEGAITLQDLEALRQRYEKKSSQP